MGVRIRQRTYNNGFTPQSTDWLLGNAWDVQELILELEMAVDFIPDSQNKVQFQNPNNYVLLNGKDWSDYGFQIGQSVTLKFSLQTNSGTPAFGTLNFIILDLINDVMVTNQPVPNYGITMAPGENFDGTNRFKLDNLVFYTQERPEAIKFSYSQVENQSTTSVNSVFDGSVTEFVADEIHLLSAGGLEKTLTPINYQSGNPIWFTAIQYIAQEDYKHIYNLRAIFFINGLPSTITDLQTETPPSWMAGVNCLTDNFNIEVYPVYNNPNLAIKNNISDSFKLGNTGYYDENFNGLPDNYEIESVQYAGANGALISGIDYQNETLVIIRVSGPNIAAGTKAAINFNYFPQDDERIKTRRRNLMKNVFLSNCFSGTQNNTFTATANPIIDPTVYQGFGYQNRRMDIKDVACYVSGSELVFQATFSPSNEFGAYFDSLTEENRNYVLSIAIQDQSLDTNSSDRVTKLVDFREMTTIVVPAGPWDLSTVFIETPEDETALGSTELCGYIEDLVLTKTLFYVDKNNEFINSIKLVIEAENNATTQVQELESNIYNVSNSVVDSQGVQQINIIGSRNFILPNGSDKNIVSIQRKPSEDTASKVAYEILYPFTIRWEDWLENSDIANNFFDSNELNDNFNNDWFTKQINDFRLYFTIITNATVNDETNVYLNRLTFDVKDYEQSSEWTGEITHYDQNGNTLFIGLDSDGLRQNAIMNNENTLFESIFTTNGSLLSIGEYTVEMCIKEFQNGTIANINRLLSKFAITSTGQLRPLINETNVKLTALNASQLKAECEINYTELNQNSTYETTSRLYGGIDAPPPIEIGVNSFIVDVQDGVWDNSLSFTQGGSPISGSYVVKIQFINPFNSSVLGEADFNYGDDILTATPISESNYTSNIKPYIVSGVLNNGGNIEFDKLMYSVNSGDTSQPYTGKAIDIQILISISTNTGSDIMGVQKFLSTPNLTREAAFDNQDVVLTRSNANELILIDKNEGTTISKGLVYVDGEPDSSDILCLSQDDQRLSNGKPIIIGVLESTLTNEFRICEGRYDGAGNYEWFRVSDNWTLAAAPLTDKPQNIIMDTFSGRQVNGRLVFFLSAFKGGLYCVYWDGSKYERSLINNFGVNFFGYTSSCISENGDILTFVWNVPGTAQHRIYKTRYLSGLPNQSSSWYINNTLVFEDTFDYTNAGILRKTSDPFGRNATLIIAGYDNVIGATSGNIPMFYTFGGDSTGFPNDVYLLEWNTNTNTWDYSFKFNLGGGNDFGLKLNELTNEIFAFGSNSGFKFNRIDQQPENLVQILDQEETGTVNQFFKY